MSFRMRLTAFPTLLAAALIASGSGASAPLLAPLPPITAQPILRVVDPIPATQASAILRLEGQLILVDPVGPQAQYRAYGRPDIVILTAPAPSHTSIDTMIGLLRRDTVVLAPQAVIDGLPLMISNNTIAPFEVGTMQEVAGIRFRALDLGEVPANTQIHERTRGDIGVLVEAGAVRLLF